MIVVLIVIGAIFIVGFSYLASLLRAAAVRPAGLQDPAHADATVLQGDHGQSPADAEQRAVALARAEDEFRTRQSSLAAFEGRLAETTQGLAASQAELSERHEELDRRTQELAQRELAAQGAPAAVGPTTAELAEAAEREAAFVEREVALEQRLLALGDRQVNLAERDTALADRETLLTERGDRLASRADRLGHREDQLTHREDLAAKDAARLEERRTQLEAERSHLLQEQQTLTQLKDQQLAELERIAGLTAQAAAAELTSSITEQAKRAAAISVRDLEAEAKRDADRRAREVVSQAIQRVASQQTSESVVSVIHLPGDDMKGRIIGREGRNIRTFETLTGVNVMIDDTPEAVSLSCFDPVRREIARVTLGALVADGRIHPQRIEDAYEQAKAEVEAQIDVTGRDTLLDVGLDDAHPELVTLLGRLKYRTSYGQNVLGHLVETAHIASGMAAELGLGKEGTAVVKRAAFFHDIGKALTHEVEGSHALIGADVARRCGESEEVVHAIAAHHLEVAPQTVEAWLTIGSDSCSGGRPGARRESLEAYVDRLKRIEEIAYSREGVERVFAMSAGRELRVMVLPDEVDDLGSQVLARDIAKQIEEELTYPGQIKVTVIRESRASETAH